MRKNLISFAFLGLSFLSPFEALVPTVPVAVAEKSLDLTTRYPDPWVNGVFRDNILLTLHFLAGDVKEKPDWEKIRQPFEVSFTLAPGEIFAFHENVLPEFEDRVVKTTGAHFNWQDGFKSDGWLTGDGVCHLASLMNWVASEAGLRVVAHVNHDFLPVPGVPREYGTSIFWLPSGGWRSQNQNLYIENTFDYPIKFTFEITPDKVVLTLSR